MKLKFVNQQYQTDAVNSIVNIFEGCEIKNSLFTIDVSNDKGFNKDSGYTGEGVSYFTGHANKVSIDDFTMLENVQHIQEENDIQRTKSLENKNFTIEMETGTGKTYVFP